jgi:hypothetical protein
MVKMLPPIVSTKRVEGETSYCEYLEGERVRILPPIVSIQRVEGENVTSYCEYPEGRG